MSFVELKFTFVALLLGVTSCYQAWYERSGRDYQLLRGKSVIADHAVTSEEECALKCLELGKKCLSFTFDNHSHCRLSFVRIPSIDAVPVMFKRQVGSNLYTKKNVDSPEDTLITPNATYVLLNQSHPWYEAFELCPLFGEGFNLASVESEVEKNTIAAWLNNLILTDNVWLAGTRESHEDCWLWAETGLPIVDYTAWSRRQPAESHVNEHCVIMRPENDYEWASQRCTQPSLFLCKQRNQTSAPPPLTLHDVHNKVC